MFQHTKPRYTINDLLDLLGIGRASLYAAINDGSLATHKCGKRRFATPEALDKYVEICEQKGRSVDTEAGQSPIDQPGAMNSQI